MTAINLDELETSMRHWFISCLNHVASVEMLKISQPTLGSSNETYFLNLTYRNRQKQSCTEQYVLRTAVVGTFHQVFPNYDLSMQANVMLRLADTDIPAPRVAYIEADSDYIGRPFYLMDRMKGTGVPQQPPYNMMGWLKEDVGKDVRYKMWRSGIQMMAKIHKVDWIECGFDFLLEDKNTTDLVLQEIQEYSDFLDWVELKANKVYDKLRMVEDWLLDERPPIPHTCLLWGDANISNLLFDGPDVTAVVDFEMSRIGDPVNDLAWWYTIDNAMSEGLEHLVGEKVPKLPGIPERDEIIAIWEKEMGIKADHFDYYEVFSVWKFSIVMASIGTNLTATGDMPAEMEFDINHNVSPLLERLIQRHGIK